MTTSLLGQICDHCFGIPLIDSDRSNKCEPIGEIVLSEPTTQAELGFKTSTKKQDLLCFSRFRASVRSCSALITFVTFAAHAGTIDVTASFSKYTGDVSPVSAPFETFINNVQVPVDDPLNASPNGFYQGTLALPSGTSSVDFAVRQMGLGFNSSSRLSIAGATGVPVPQKNGDVFRLGTLSLKNGVFLSQGDFELTFSTQSMDPFFDGNTFKDTFRYVATPNTGDPVANALANADYVYFLGHSDLGRVRIYETSSGLGDTGSVEIWGKAGPLEPLFFANPRGGAFLEAPPASVPDGGTPTFPMMGLGIIGVAMLRKARIASSANI